MGGKKNGKKQQVAERDAMAAVLATFKSPSTTDWGNAWAGLEPTFQTEKSIKKWWKACEQGEAGEDAYFEDDYMLETQREVAKAVAVGSPGTELEFAL